MKFISITAGTQLREEPNPGDIVIVDYTTQGTVPDDFERMGHKRGKYLCETVKRSSGGDMLLAVLYDLDQQRPFSCKSKDLFIHKTMSKSAPWVGTRSGAPALSSGWITRKEVDRMIDDYNRKVKT